MKIAHWQSFTKPRLLSWPSVTNEHCLLHRLIPHVKGNVGFVFTKEDLTTVRDLILANKVAAPAKAGAIAPIDVFVPKGNTGLGPEKTSFFQALAIPTKIAKGTIEILVCTFLFLTSNKSSELWGASISRLLPLLYFICGYMYWSLLVGGLSQAVCSHQCLATTCIFVLAFVPDNFNFSGRVLCISKCVCKDSQESRALNDPVWPAQNAKQIQWNLNWQLWYIVWVFFSLKKCYQFYIFVWS